MLNRPYYNNKIIAEYKVLSDDLGYCEGEMMQNQYDIIIVGAGLVGASLAAILAQQGLRLAVLETHIPQSLTQHCTDSRPLALNYKSQNILKTLGIWEELAQKACAIMQVMVSEQGHFGKIRFNAANYRLPALGYVVSMDQLHQLLYRQITSSPLVTFFSIEKLLQLECDAHGAEVQVAINAKKSTLRASLLVGADGSHSATRQLCGITNEQHNLHEFALITTLQLQAHHRHIAYERFTNNGVLALLPLQNEQHVRLVWTLSQSQKQLVESWSKQQFNTHINECFSGYVGPIQSIDAKPQSIALHTNHAKQQIKPGLVLLGNAAHTIYPLAAQGFNLSLADAAVLADILMQAHQQQQPLGDMSVLQTYLHKREPQQHWISRTTSHINQIFGLQLPILGHCRSLGLLFTDVCWPLKRYIGNRMLGLYSNPL